MKEVSSPVSTVPMWKPGNQIQNKQPLQTEHETSLAVSFGGTSPFLKNLWQCHGGIFHLWFINNQFPTLQHHLHWMVKHVHSLETALWNGHNCFPVRSGGEPNPSDWSCSVRHSNLRSDHGQQTNDEHCENNKKTMKMRCKVSSHIQ